MKRLGLFGFGFKKFPENEKKEIFYPKITLLSCVTSLLSYPPSGGRFLFVRRLSPPAFAPSVASLRPSGKELGGNDDKASAPAPEGEDESALSLSPGSMLFLKQVAGKKFENHIILIQILMLLLFLAYKLSLSFEFFVVCSFFSFCLSVSLLL